jgi:large subunit ribosomal protein L35
MPKIKTHKATAKRFKVTGTGKLKYRKGGQDHFNSKETGKTTRQKRKDKDVYKGLVKTVKKLTPYS